MNQLLGPLILVMLGAAVVLWWRARGGREAAGLPSGRVVYADTGAWQKNERPLFSKRHNLTGKPDYLVREGASLIPVEVKSRAAPDAPYLSHVMQLAAYGLLVEEALGAPAPYGLIHYRDQTFRVDFTPALRRELLALLAEMRRGQRAKAVHRNHSQPQRCAHCGYQAVCGESL
ncbi:MAG: CRISPR-associated protein Cas4 [Chloroflexi bacterium]|nr:CRISPR-associated protein Cas4 [Chloroflexota bacterium]MBI3732017.1 CRISPR-associated protein Cas4 [Chloroflexota bacterium]